MFCIVKQTLKLSNASQFEISFEPSQSFVRFTVLQSVKDKTLVLETFHHRFIYHPSISPLHLYLPQHFSPHEIRPQDLGVDLRYLFFRRPPTPSFFCRFGLF